MTMAFSSLAARTLGEGLCCAGLFVCFIGDQLVHTNSTFLCQDQSTVAQWAETTVAKCPWWAACELVSLMGSHSKPGQYNQPIPTLLGQGCMSVLGVNCHLHFWQNDWSLLCATAVTRSGTIQVSTESWLSSDTSLAAPARTRPLNLSITSLAVYLEAVRLNGTPQGRQHWIRGSQKPTSPKSDCSCHSGA